MDAPKTLKQALIQGLRNREDYDQTLEKETHDIYPHLLNYLDNEFIKLFHEQEGRLGGGTVRDNLFELWLRISGAKLELEKNPD
jgi:hypothetical protein